MCKENIQSIHWEVMSWGKCQLDGVKESSTDIPTYPGKIHENSYAQDSAGKKGY
jgi:hypothetical protein